MDIDYRATMASKERAQEALHEALHCNKDEDRRLAAKYRARLKLTAELEKQRYSINKVIVSTGDNLTVRQYSRESLNSELKTQKETFCFSLYCGQNRKKKSISLIMRNIVHKRVEVHYTERFIFDWMLEVSKYVESSFLAIF
jgi:hypothetical protein